MLHGIAENISHSLYDADDEFIDFIRLLLVHIQQAIFHLPANKSLSTVIDVKVDFE